MKIAYLRSKLICIAVLPIALVIREIFSYNQQAAENLYSRLIYPPIGRSLSKLTGIVSFSAAEILVYACSAALVFLIVRAIIKLIKSTSKHNQALSIAINAACIISIVYSSFLFLWGYNYYRQPLSYSLGYEIRQSSTEDLKKLCKDLIIKANDLRTGLPEDSEGIFYIEGGYKSVISHSALGYQNLSKIYPIFSGNYGKPKGIAASKFLCYTGISGIYFPFTGEANVNTQIPYSTLPATVCHEMAHQRGFAREDEANFIGYLACKHHNDASFRYSGYLLALIYSMDALHEYDKDAFSELAATYSSGLSKDLNHYSAFWKQYEGPVEEIQERINDAYLKSNKQEDGVHSYGRMVDLLLAEYKTSLQR